MKKFWDAWQVPVIFLVTLTVLYFSLIKPMAGAYRLEAATCNINHTYTVVIPQHGKPYVEP